MPTCRTPSVAPGKTHCKKELNRELNKDVNKELNKGVNKELNKGVRWKGVSSP